MFGTYRTLAIARQRENPSPLYSLPPDLFEQGVLRGGQTHQRLPPRSPSPSRHPLPVGTTRQKRGTANPLALAGNPEVSSSRGCLHPSCLARQRWSCPAPDWGVQGREAIGDAGSSGGSRRWFASWTCQPVCCFRGDVQ